MDFLANLVTVVHLAYFVFVVGGFVSIVIGIARRWGWVFNFWFRIAHLLSVLVVLVENVTGWNCPLNVLEGSLRSSPTEAAEASSGIGWVLDQLLHHTIPERALEVMYWLFGLVLVLLFVFAPPRFRKHS